MGKISRSDIEILRDLARTQLEFAVDSSGREIGRKFDYFIKNLKEDLPKLEIAQRDVYTINNDVNKAKRYVEVVRECIEENWR